MMTKWKKKSVMNICRNAVLSEYKRLKNRFVKEFAVGTNDNVEDPQSLRVFLYFSKGGVLDYGCEQEQGFTAGLLPLAVRDGAHRPGGTDVLAGGEGFAQQDICADH